MKKLYSTADTAQDAYEKQLELLRRTSPITRLELAMTLSSQLKQMSLEAIRRHHPEFDERLVPLRFIELTYGAQLAEGVARQLQSQSDSGHAS